MSLARMTATTLLLVGCLTGCAAASGYDAKRYAKDAAAPDPDTAPLPSQPKTTIPDPKRPIERDGGPNGQ